MKQFKTLFAAILIVFMSNMTFSQDYVFRVLAKKGENSVSTDGKTWSALKTGSSLKAGQLIKVGDGSYLGLVHSTGKTYEIKKAGISKVNDLAAKVNVAESSVAAKYASFVMNKMSATDEDINKNHRKYLSATGAVTRGPNSVIKMFLPSQSQFYGKDAILEWTEFEDSESDLPPVYILTLTNMFDEVIFSEETSESNYKVNLGEDKYKNEQMIILEVTVKGAPSLEYTKYAIKRIDEDVAKPIILELKELNQLVAENTAMNKLILASFYEKNSLMMDAMTNYRAAMELAPDVAIFRHAYEQFIVTNALGTK